MKLENIFIDSDKLDPDWSDKTGHKYCMAPFVENKENPTDLTWTLGSVFLENYYVVFDMSADLYNSTAVNQIAYGPINPRNVLGDSIYNTDSSHF